MSAMDKLPPTRVTICRKISFSSAHRYWRPDLTEEENRAIYGSKYSPHGHGHNFVLEASLEGVMDPETGMVVNLKDLDADLKAITDPLDHHHLNLDVPFFAETVPTTENIAAYCFAELQKCYPGGDIHVRKVRLYEGSDLWVDIEPAGVSKGSSEKS